MKLTFAENSRSFVLTTRDAKAGDTYGLTSYTGYQVPGEYQFFTANQIRGRYVPAYNPFAVLPLFHVADPGASVELLDHWLAYQESLATTSDVTHPSPDDCTYMPFQSSGISYALKRKHTLFGDEPGLGKTVEAIGVCNATDARNILIVCPASVRLQWAKEITKWRIRPCSLLGHGEERIWPVLNGRDVGNTTASVVIVSYQLAASLTICDWLNSRAWDVVIFDEAHYLKSYKAIRTRRLLGTHDGSVIGLANSAERILALTGTPLPNRPREAYTLARALDFGAIDEMSEDAFLAKYNPMTVMPNGHRVEYTGHLLELQMRLRTRFMVRRAKVDVLKDLPSKVYELTHIEPDGNVLSALRAERMLDIDPDTAFLSGDPEMMAAIATVRRMMGDAKVPAVVAHISGLLDGGVDKVVCFAYHTSVIAALMKAFGNVATVIQGSTPSKMRERAKVRFQEDPTCRIFIGQLTAAGTGVDGLQNVCSNAVFAEASWVPGENDQCVDRLNRHGQTQSVLAQFLVAPDSLDAKILGSAIRKVKATNIALDETIGNS